MPHFVFPTDPLDPRRIDEYFDPQRAALEAAGHTFSLVADRLLEDGGSLPGIPANAQVVYRGWMFTEHRYQCLERAVVAAGGQLLTSVRQYLATHHLPNWYPLLADLTPLTRVFSQEADLSAELQALGWPGFFVKEYVKSLKTSVGSRITDPKDIGRVISEMRTFRDEIEGGICIRQLEPIQTDTERRYFVLNGRAFASRAADGIPTPVSVAAARIDSPFFTVDIAQRSDGVSRIIELGDGQVSDLVGWSPEDFVRIWRPSGSA